MPYLYGIADTKFLVKKSSKVETANVSKTFMPPVKFRRNHVIPERIKFNPHEWPIQFRISAATLVELCVNVVDKLPISSVYEWDDMDVRRWICRYGYPQYMNTFRVNMISGRKLLLLDADALQAMNIKDFDHIRHITYGIRMLFHFELTKFSHSISLPDEKPNELYLLWHTQTGVGYDKVRRSDLYRRMKLIRERALNLDHWDMLEMWLRRERERKYSELIALVPRVNLFGCPKDETIPKHVIPESLSERLCDLCIPPCDCNWTAKDTLLPWRLSCLRKGLPPSHSRWVANERKCKLCIPPCECSWPSRYYLTGTVIKCLQHNFPEKFSPIFDERITTVVRPSLIERWTRFSF
ncbi:uncharacterized protein LOC133835349 [Drosophila sulfurigaster albostrigata]|uniref:uncharacterized protein LOC133835349 n=1 Tax=Drosophila sulfurigaster albostrigata TaxID=89887 RepID=UPI002D21CF6E|nr:uncharacterized protein LOC133835349 [Drosophila sulfurigaster albostrigata]